MEFDLLLFAQGAANAQDVAGTQGLPDWTKAIMGPLGALVICLGWIFHTEKNRLPGVKQEVKENIDSLVARVREEQKEKEDLRQRLQGELDQVRKHSEEQLEKLRRHYEEQLNNCKAKASGERGWRVWYESQAKILAAKHGDELPAPPDDMDKTFLG